MIVTAKSELHNSRMLAILDEILHDSSSPWGTVELAGRGISARVRCTIALAEDKTTDSSGLSHAERMAAVDKLIALGDLEDELEDLWQRRCADELTAADFQTTLEGMIQWLEAWPAHLTKP